LSPLRAWMTTHRLPSWYAWVVVVVVPVMVSMGVLVITLRVNERSVERERTARIASQQTFCQVFILLDSIYRQAAPPTPAGKQIAAAVAFTVARNCR
jgi:hypothetical protein